MAPLTNNSSIDPALAVSKYVSSQPRTSQEDPRIIAERKRQQDLEKKKQAQKAVSTIITKGITSGQGVNAPVVPAMIKTPIQQINRSSELPVVNPTSLPNGQPIIAGNVSPQSMETQPESNFVSKERLKQVLDQVPQERKHILLRAIIAKGKIVEGYNDPQSQIKQAPVLVAPQISYGENKLQDQNKSIKGSILPGGPFKEIGPVRQKFDTGLGDYVGGQAKNWATSAYNIVPQLGNALASPYQTAKGLGKGLLGILINVGDEVGKVTGAGKLSDTLKEMGVDDSTIGKVLIQSDEVADQLGQVMKNKYGSFEKLSKTAYEDPVGVLSDALTVIGGAGVVVKGATFGSKVGTAGKVGRVADDLIKVGALDPYNLVTEGAIKGAVGATKFAGRGVSMAGDAGLGLLGKATGTSADTIKEIYKRAGSKPTVDALRGTVDDQKILASVEKGVSDIADQRRKLYGSDYEILKNNTNKIDLKTVKGSLLDELTDGLNVKIVDGKLDFSKSKITSSSAQKEIIDIYSDINKWDDLTPSGVDILKQRVADRWKGTVDNAKSDRIVTKISNEIKGLITSKVPEYARMTKKYEEISDLLKDIKGATGVGGKGSASTAITKLKGVLRDNQEFRKAMIEEIEKYSGSDILGQIAGSQMSAIMPRGLAGVGLGITGVGLGGIINPAFLASALASSPRVVGEVANALGIGAKKIQSYIDNVKSMIPKKNTIPTGKVIQALPEKTQTNIGTKNNPIIGRVKDVKTIEKGVATKPGTTKVDLKAIGKQGETPVKTVPKTTETKVEPKKATVDQELQNIAKKIKEKSIAKKENGSIMDGMKNYKSFDDYFNSLTDQQLIDLKSNSNKTILERAKIRKMRDEKNPKVVIPKKDVQAKNVEVKKDPNVLDNLNPTGGLYVKYDPAKRANMKLAENITTLDKTMKVSPDKEITIYRGTVKKQSDIVPGDFITTNYDLAKSYAGEGKVISKKVKASDVLDDINEPLGDEYIYRPKLTSKSDSSISKELQPLYEEANKSNTPDFLRKISKK